MRIENAINQICGPETTERREAEVRRRRSVPNGGDVVEISQAARELGQVDLGSVDDVRGKLVEEVKRRVASGYYDRPEVLRAIADAVLNSGIVSGVAEEVKAVSTLRSAVADLPEVRQDRIAQAAERVASGFYNSSRAAVQVADRVLDGLVG